MTDYLDIRNKNRAKTHALMKRSGYADNPASGVTTDPQPGGGTDYDGDKPKMERGGRAGGK